MMNGVIKGKLRRRKSLVDASIQKRRRDSIYMYRLEKGEDKDEDKKN